MQNDKLKILHITEPTIDGVKTHIVDLLSNLNTHDYEITLLFSLKRSDPKFIEELASLKARGIHTFRCDLSGQISPIEDLVSLLNVFKFIQNRKFDIVHCHSSKAGFLARFASKILQVPVVIYTPHAFSFFSNNGSIRRLFHVYLEKLAAKFCDSIICVSQSEKRTAVGFNVAPENKFKVIPNAINLRRIKSAQKIDLSEKYPEIIRNSDIIISTVGRLSFQKAPDLFVKAASIVAKKFDNAKFFYIGQGELRKSVEKLALKLGLNSRIIFTGYRNDVLDILKSSHIFVLCSRYEGLPYSILEAMALKLPVVATDVTGTSELVITNKTGILVPPENTDAIAQAMIYLIRHPEKRIKLGLAGYTHVFENHNLKTMIHSTEQFYKAMLHNKTGILNGSKTLPQ